MTDKQPLVLPRYKIGYYSDEQGVRSSTPTGIPDPEGTWVRFEHAQTLIAHAQRRHEAELEAIGAGGVSGPLLGQPQAMPDLSQLTERGAKAWAGVDAQALREGAQARPVGDDAEAAARRSFPQWWSDMGASLCGVDPLASSPPQTYAARGFMGGYVAALAAQAPQPAITPVTGNPATVQGAAITSEYAAPQRAAPAVGGSGFDHRTAACILDGKAVSDEYIRKFVQASRWAHDDRASLQATLQSVRDELASREAEIALLKKALMDAETAPPQEVQEPRPVTPYTCPKCHALWLHWPAEQSGFGMDTLNCRSADHCHYCEKGGVEQLERLERVPAVLKAPEPAPSGDVWKDGDTAALVNQLRDVAIEYRDTQQLRERIAHIVRPLADRAAPSGDAEDAARYRWLRATTNYATSNGERIDVRNMPEAWDAVIDAARKEGDKP